MSMLYPRPYADFKAKLKPDFDWARHRARGKVREENFYEDLASAFQKEQPTRTDGKSLGFYDKFGKPMYGQGLMILN